MFRKALLPLLCAATIAAAIPLHIGESWAWQVTNRDSLDLTYRSAVVVDSTRIPAGKVWTLVARDSVLKKSDTAKILVWPSGRQTWLRQSRFLSWELQPRDPGDTTVVVLGADTSSVWGEASSLEPVVHANRFVSIAEKRTCDSLQKLEPERSCDSIVVGRSRVAVDAKSVAFKAESVVKSTPLPVHIWSDTLGMARALTYHRSRRGIDWRLVSHNLHPIAPPMDELGIPATQTVFEWSASSGSASSSQSMGSGSGSSSIGTWSNIRWKISGHESDSAGWAGLSVSQTVITCSKVRSCTPSRYANCGTIIDDSVCQAPVVEDLVIWIHPGRGQSFANKTKVPSLQIGWIRSWETAPTMDSIAIARVWESRDPLGSQAEAYVEVWKDGALAELSYSASSYQNSGFWSSSSGSSASSYKLIGIYPPGTEPPVSIRPKASNITSLKDLAQTFPNTPVRWSTASGRTGTIAASEIVQFPVALRGKTVFLLARLPDGRVWQGTHVVP